MRAAHYLLMAARSCSMHCWWPVHLSQTHRDPSFHLAGSLNLEPERQDRLEPAVGGVGPGRAGGGAGQTRRKIGLPQRRPGAAGGGAGAGGVGTVGRVGCRYPTAQPQLGTITAWDDYSGWLLPGYYYKGVFPHRMSTSRCGEDIQVRYKGPQSQGSEVARGGSLHDLLVTLNMKIDTDHLK